MELRKATFSYSTHLHKGVGFASFLSRNFSTILASLCIGLGAIVAWSLLDLNFKEARPKNISTYEIKASFAGANPELIAQELFRSKSNKRDTSLETKRPSWVLGEIPERGSNETLVIEFDVLRFDNARFWLAFEKENELYFVEARPLERKTGPSSKGGFSIEIKENLHPKFVLAELHSFMATPIVVRAWGLNDYISSELNYERRGGALFGGMLILAAFGAIVALANRDFTFLLFAGWAITSLRIAAINAGWDRFWIGLDISTEPYLAILRAMISAYGYFTFSFFRSLLKNGGGRKWHSQIHSFFEKGFLGFIIASPFASHIEYLKYFWLYASISLGLLTLQVVYFALKHRSRLSILYALSWGCMILGMASEISDKSGVSNYPLWINSQTASVVSALIMGLALADRLRSERDGRLAAQAKSLQYLKKYEDNFNTVPVGLFMVNQDGTLRLRNPAFDAMFSVGHAGGLERGHIDGLTHVGLFEQMRHAVQQGLSDVEIASQDASGAPRWFLARVRSHDDVIEGSIQDITTRKVAENQLKHLVDHDYLTGLLNRRSLEKTLERALRAVQQNVACAVSCIDIDRFKLINDLHGHAVGDALLVQAAERLRLAVRATDAIARVADSFFVVSFDCDPATLAGLAERMRAAFNERPFEVDGRGLNATASVGVVCLASNMSGVDAMAAADRACREAKARGRNCVVQFSEGDDEMQRHLEELRVVADLQQRVPTERYFLEFQPIVALQAGLVDMNYEVLIRMRDEAGRVIQPGKFIGAAERNGLMGQIDRWVLRHTLEWLDQHPKHLEHVGFVTINLSGASLNDTRFIADAFALMTEHPKAVSKLCFEITESVALHDVSSTRGFVDRLRMFNAKVALDDFGAGYTSFNYLREIPADFIKIDGSFILDINHNAANYAITRMIVDLTHELGMECIAEWAENRDTVASLIELGVDYGQGFGLVRPMAPALMSGAISARELLTDPDICGLLHTKQTAARPYERRHALPAIDRTS